MDGSRTDANIRPWPLLTASLVAILLGTGLVVYSLTVRQSSRRQSSRDQEIVSQLDGVQSLIVDAETGQRGYILTGKPDYLDPYRSAQTQVLPAIDALEANMRTAGADATMVSQLREHWLAKFNELQKTIAAFDAGHPNEAKQIIQSGVGKREMDAIRDVVSRMRKAQLERLQRNVNRRESVLRWLYVSVLAFGILALLTTLVMMREVRMRSLLAARIQTVNEIAHELNNPLQSTTNIFAILKSGKSLPPDVLEHLRVLESEHNRITLVSRRVLSRTETEQPGRAS